jgi:hypothetical protein
VQAGQWPFGIASHADGLRRIRRPLSIEQRQWGLGGVLQLPWFDFFISLQECRNIPLRNER